jgi:aspartyl-tRNA(Asn)/glutamyl-tRNA(Gln) amidotransferase subunit A
VTDDIFFAPITDLNARLRRKEFSCQELTRAYLDRLERLGPRYNALALLLKESAVSKAKDVDGDIKRERFRGMLQGIPYGAKDLLSARDQPTGWGARPYAGQVFKYDATVIKKLAGTGAVLTSKLAMVELAGGGGYRFPAASVSGPGLNPWNRSHWSGGSSSGSGAAVAAGLVPFALGSETSGSILTPAAFCGVTGLRPSYGLVSRYGAMALSWTLDKVGPLGRSAEDCGYVLQAIAGGDNKDPGTAGKSFYYVPQFARPLNELTVAYAPVDFDGWADPAARAGFQAAVEVVRSLGVKLVEARIPDFPYGAVLGPVIGAESASIFEEFIRGGKVDELADKKQIAGLKASLDIPATDYLKAMRIRSLIRQAFHEFFAEYDAILTTSRSGPASRISEALDAASGRPAPADRGFSGIIPAGNLAGLPALSLPCGFAGELPIGIQLVTRAFNENLILAIGKAFQDRTDWHKRRPKI